MKRLYQVLACSLFVLMFFVNAVHSQTDILDARTNYSVGQTVTVTGIVTSDGNLGPIRYLQDETAGIALYPGLVGLWIAYGWPDPQPGDELTMTGALNEYNGLLEVGPDGITDVTVLSTGNELPAFQTITPNDMNESMEGELAYIPDVVFTNGGTIITGNSTFSFTAAGENGIIYVGNDNELVGQVLPAGEVDLYGVVSQFSFDGVGGYHLLPRGNEDLSASSWTGGTSIVTFNLNMEWETVSDEGVYLGGGVIGGPTEHELTDPDGDGVYSVEVVMDNGTTGNYIFLNGNCPDWSCKEDLEGLPCSDPANWNDRILPEINGDMTISTCFGQCVEETWLCQAPPPTSVITFRVDMSDYTGSYGVVNLNGSFNGWCGDCAVMTDEDADGVYEISIELNNESTYEYKFTLDGWSNPEVFEGGDYPCTSVTWDGYINRTLTVGLVDTVLDAVCYNSCFTCDYDPTNFWFYEDFANGFAGNNGVGAWTAEDSGGGLIWQAVNSAGEGFYVDGMTSGVYPPAGEYSSNIGVLNSTSADNGWIIFDNDYYNTPISNGYEDTEGWITSPSLDFSGVGSVNVAWEQYFRYCCYSYAPIYLQVSSDGGESWTTFDAHGTFIESANSTSANALHTSVDISCAAAYQPNVLIRFSYLQPPETGSGYSHYYWGIDDVTIYENSETHDLQAVLLANGDIDNAFEYRVTPMEQAVSVEEGGLLAGLRFKNSGTEDEYASVLIEVLDSNETVLSTTFESLGVVYAPVNSVSCPTPSFESVYISTGWSPTVAGTYTLRATLFSDSAEDDTPDDNVISKTIIYSDYVMGHDDEGALDAELSSGESDLIEGWYDPFGYGNFFQMENEGSVAYGIAVRFGPNSGGGEVYFETRLHSTDGSDLNNSSNLEGWGWGEFNDSWAPDSAGSSDYIYLPFDDPIELETDIAYFAAIISEWENEGQLTVLSNADSDTDNSTGRYGQSGAGDFMWFTTSPFTPAIRLVLSPELFTYPGCTDAIACNFNPDAEEDNGSCEYESCAGCMEVEACNFDPSATISDAGLCTYPGCDDPSAANYEASAGCIGECIYLTYDCASIGDGAWSDEAMGLFPDWQEAVHGIPWEGEWVFNVPGTIIEPGSGVPYGVHHVDWVNMEGVPGWATAMSLDEGEVVEASTQLCIPAFGTPTTPGTHEVTAIGEVFISIFGQPFSIGEQSFPAWLEVEENPNPIPGCTYATAQNFLAFATLDDGSCEFAGCTDPEADNFNPLATIEDGSCGEGCDTASDASCQADNDGDGLISVSDLLILLGEFGSVCE